ncbi:phytanoyl-CoA dioxygenase family protein, partial [Arthrobacter sp. 260]|uniref:phytanoyl-CoA dioxygenase family protein n=1 Tax=Arthrobacter sp. 260 TaxID=2735314 RepID=UPI0014918919
MFAIHSSAFLKSIGEDKKLKSILKLLLQKEAVLFQSINFLKGSEQKTHSDSIHMSSFPLGNLVAIWVALEDIDETNG